MNKGRGESGERRETHSMPLQWCSHGQSKTTTLTFSDRSKQVSLHMKTTLVHKNVCAQKDISVQKTCWSFCLLSAFIQIHSVF